MDAAARWLRDNDPEYKKDLAIRKRKNQRRREVMEGGNMSRSSTPRQMRGVVKENLGGKSIAKSGAKPTRRGKRGGRNKPPKNNA